MIDKKHRLTILVILLSFNCFSSSIETVSRPPLYHKGQTANLAAGSYYIVEVYQSDNNDDLYLNILNYDDNGTVSILNKEKYDTGSFPAITPMNERGYFLAVHQVGTT